MHKILLFPILAMMICSCAPKNSSVTIHDKCLLDKPMTFSAQDTPATRRQIQEYDAKGMDLCGW